MPEDILNPDTNPESDDDKKGGAHDEKGGAGDNDNKDNVRTFTQDEVNELIKDRIARERAKFEKTLNAKVEEVIKERQRLSELSDEELAKEKLTQKEKELQERENKLKYKEMLADTEQILRDRKLPTSFAEFLIAEDNDATLNNIKAFQTAFTEAVKAEVKKELSGKTPETYDNKEKTWTREEIRKVKDPNKRLALIEQYKDLFN